MKYFSKLEKKHHINQNQMVIKLFPNNINWDKKNWKKFLKLWSV